MKRLFQRILPLLLTVFLLASCAQQPQEILTSAYTAEEMVLAIANAQTEELQMQTVGADEEYFATYVAGYYQLDAALIADGAISFAGGVKAREIAVFQLAAEADTAQVKTALEAYQTSRAGAFTGYAPEEAALVERGRVVVQGQFVALLLCEEPAIAEETFLACFTDALPPLPSAIEATPEVLPTTSPETTVSPSAEASPEATVSPSIEPSPETTEENQPVFAPQETVEVPVEPVPEESVAPVSNEYDRATVLQAWQTGDEASLSEKNRLVLETCREIIGQIITERMTDYQKELAIHDWIVTWAEYDPDALDHSEGAQSDPDNQNPYGLLINQKAICSGYSTTFQLFMDLVEIECITVHGTAHRGAEPHAWNMVRLDGEWYCVDLTWDDPVGLYEFNDYLQHRYFNVTSEYLRNNDHQWDEESVPTATATEYAYG